MATPSAGLLDTILLRGLTFSAAGLTRVRISSVDTSDAAGDVKDTGWLSSGSQCFDAAYGALCYLHPSPVAGFFRIDINDPGAAYVVAERLAAPPSPGFSVLLVGNGGVGGSATSMDRPERAGPAATSSYGSPGGAGTPSNYAMIVTVSAMPGKGEDSAFGVGGISPAVSFGAARTAWPVRVMAQAGLVRDRRPLRAAAPAVLAKPASS